MCVKFQKEIFLLSPRQKSAVKIGCINILFLSNLSESIILLIFSPMANLIVWFLSNFGYKYKSFQQTLAIWFPCEKANLSWKIVSKLPRLGFSFTKGSLLLTFFIAFLRLYGLDFVFSVIVLCCWSGLATYYQAPVKQVLVIHCVN